MFKIPTDAHIGTACGANSWVSSTLKGAAINSSSSELLQGSAEKQFG